MTRPPRGIFIYRPRSVFPHVLKHGESIRKRVGQQALVLVLGLLLVQLLGLGLEAGAVC
jgi:hypothetical protein